jgi:hypothetical protein
MALESFCLGQTQKCGGVKPANGIPTLFIILHINCLSVGFVFFIYHLQKIYAFFWQNDHLYVLLMDHCKKFAISFKKGSKSGPNSKILYIWKT